MKTEKQGVKLREVNRQHVTIESKVGKKSERTLKTNLLQTSRRCNAEEAQQPLMN